MACGSSFEIFSGGGIGVLDPETSKAWTASIIFTPQSWLWDGGKFSFAVDYIDIKVKDQVTQLGAGNILFACYTSESFPDDPLCDLFDSCSGRFAERVQHSDGSRSVPEHRYSA